MKTLITILFIFVCLFIFISRKLYLQEQVKAAQMPPQPVDRMIPDGEQMIGNYHWFFWRDKVTLVRIACVYGPGVQGGCVKE